TSLLAPSVLDYFEKENSFPDVSVGEFRKLLADRGTTRTGVSRPGRTLDLHFPFAAGHVSGIREAIFRVEEDTFLAAELILAMGETDHLREYHFLRSSRALVPRAGEWSTVFSTPEADLLPPATENPKVRPHLLSYANSKATKEEVAAAQA